MEQATQARFKNVKLMAQEQETGRYYYYSTLNIDALKISTRSNELIQHW